jgi:hypothetical protein
VLHVIVELRPGHALHPCIVATARQQGQRLTQGMGPLAPLMRSRRVRAAPGALSPGAHGVSLGQCSSTATSSGAAVPFIHFRKRSESADGTMGHAEGMVNGFARCQARTAYLQPFINTVPLDDDVAQPPRRCDTPPCVTATPADTPRDGRPTHGTALNFSLLNMSDRYIYLSIDIDI